jgi:hypothetical protein
MLMNNPIFTVLLIYLVRQKTLEAVLKNWNFLLGSQSSCMLPRAFTGRALLPIASHRVFMTAKALPSVQLL